MIGERRRPSVGDSDHCADGPQTAAAERADLPRHEGTRLLGVRVIAYLTNHFVSKVPSYTLRHAWYRHVVGVAVGAGAAVHLGLRLSFHGPGQVRRSSVAIGTGTRINRDCTLDARGPLQIGDHVSISPEVVILTADHDRNAVGFPLRHRGVVIEDRVWIGMRAMVLPGVRVGRGAVIAAGAVVSRDVAPLTVVAGVPARTVAIRRAEGLRYVLSKPPLLE